MAVSPVWKQLIFEIPFKTTVPTVVQEHSLEKIRTLIPSWAKNVRWEKTTTEERTTHKLSFMAPAPNLDWIEKSFVLLASAACLLAEPMTWDVVTTLGVVRPDGERS